MAKRKWWQKGLDLWDGKTAEQIFSKAIEDEKNKTPSIWRKRYDADGNEIFEDEDDFYSPYSSYNFGVDQKLTDDTYKLGKKESYGVAQKRYYDAYSSYETTGVWHGYQTRKPNLTYKYVQQMVSALSAQVQNVKVKIGNGWAVDLIEKQLTYNPSSLIYGTKGELLASLMHEIGKLRYCEHNSKIQSRYLLMYKKLALEVFSIFEDVRADYQMLKAYQGAAEIYDSGMKNINETIDNYRKEAETFRGLLPDALTKTFRNIIAQARNNGNDPHDELLKHFGVSDENKIANRITLIRNAGFQNGNIYNYCAEMLLAMYDSENFTNKKYPNIIDLILKTEGAIEPIKKQITSQGAVALADEQVFPQIEKLLRDFTTENDQLNEKFPEMPEDSKETIMRNINFRNDYALQKGGVNFTQDGNSKVRNSGASEEIIPPEWEKGDYKALKESVSNEIRELVRKLTFLRREEQTVKYVDNQRRGKINSKKLYKHATGSSRIFKKKLEQVDTIQSFAFSVLIDISGSMWGSRIIHSVRANIIFAEVFKKLNIPYEVVAFGSDSMVIKQFDQTLDSNIEKRIGGMVTAQGGGTNLDRGLDALALKHRPERNKVVVVLSDGGVSSIPWYNEHYFQPWKAKGIHSIGIGIECEEAMAELCLGNSKVLENASELPIEFSGIIKSLIKRK